MLWDALYNEACYWLAHAIRWAVAAGERHGGDGQEHGKGRCLVASHSRNYLFPFASVEARAGTSTPAVFVRIFLGMG